MSPRESFYDDTSIPWLVRVLAIVVLRLLLPFVCMLAMLLPMFVAVATGNCFYWLRMAFIYGYEGARRFNEYIG